MGKLKLATLSLVALLMLSMFTACESSSSYYGPPSPPPIDPGAARAMRELEKYKDWTPPPLPSFTPRPTITPIPTFAPSTSYTEKGFDPYDRSTWDAVYNIDGAYCYYDPYRDAFYDEYGDCWISYNSRLGCYTDADGNEYDPGW